MTSNKDSLKQTKKLTGTQKILTILVSIPVALWLFSDSDAEKPIKKISTVNTETQRNSPTNNIDQVIACQSADHPTDKTVIIIYSDNKVDYIPYSSSGIFFYALEKGIKVEMSDYKFKFPNTYYDKIELNRTSLLLNTMRVAPLYNKKGGTYEDWREQQCVLADKAIAEKAIKDVELQTKEKESERQKTLDARKI